MADDVQARFQGLMEEHKRIIFKVCNSYCRNRDDREDLAQEMIVALWQSFPAYDPNYRFSTWMYRIALNVAISFYRRESTRARYVLTSEEHVLSAVDETPAPPEEIRLLREFIEGLDPLNKGLILLYLDGHSHQEIAGVMGITETNVATKIGRLKQKLRSMQ